jgi:hypothetical protein
MEFFNNSWENMTENEQAEADLLATLEKEPAPTLDAQPDDVCFQMILSKAQKKAQKKVANASKNSYSTRSKVLQKPFR